ncbi:uncharacterized protein CIMG_13559 [Coccidioides immitis RS]|uniref:DUF7924 domain-containing protein n=1 Tax=Coccidioides immitis (strain RS) TaxID=246410 RepID=A0A0D8JWH1_COCIM|nr:uncharacterized protein CIMG_13559 [Coccidioides immitis RS]KJF61281.1 hypothetical protein CIMG_13559 [Coccidioides immitis RS]
MFLRTLSREFMVKSPANSAHGVTGEVMKAVVEHSELVNREIEIRTEILAFSISHDHAAARIYGSHTDLWKRRTTSYRHARFIQSLYGCSSLNPEPVTELEESDKFNVVVLIDYGLKDVRNKLDPIN